MATAGKKKSIVKANSVVAPAKSMAMKTKHIQLAEKNAVIAEQLTAATKPATKPATKSATKPVTKASTKPTVKPATKASNKVVAKAVTKPAAAVARARPSKAAEKKIVNVKSVASKKLASAKKQEGVKSLVDQPLIKEKFKKPKLVRDSFTMPEAEYVVLSEVKKACLAARIEVKKSQLLRIGLLLLKKTPVSALKLMIADLPALKAGRPKQN